MRGHCSPARNPSHTGLVLSDDFSASGVILGEELAGRGHEIGGYPTVGTGDIGSFCIVISVVRMTPLSDALRGGGGGQASEGRGYIRSSRDDAHLDAKYVTTAI